MGRGRRSRIWVSARAGGVKGFSGAMVRSLELEHDVRLCVACWLSEQGARTICSDLGSRSGLPGETSERRYEDGDGRNTCELPPLIGLELGERLGIIPRTMKDRNEGRDDPGDDRQSGGPSDG